MLYDDFQISNSTLGSLTNYLQLHVSFSVIKFDHKNCLAMTLAPQNHEGQVQYLKPKIRDWPFKELHPSQ